MPSNDKPLSLSFRRHFALQDLQAAKGRHFSATKDNRHFQGSLGRGEAVDKASNELERAQKAFDSADIALKEA